VRYDRVRQDWMSENQLFSNPGYRCQTAQVQGLRCSLVLWSFNRRFEQYHSTFPFYKQVSLSERDILDCKITIGRINDFLEGSWDSFFSLLCQTIKPWELFLKQLKEFLVRYRLIVLLKQFLLKADIQWYQNWGLTLKSIYLLSRLPDFSSKVEGVTKTLIVVHQFN
jgi:hypothetical protein